MNTNLLLFELFDLASTLGAATILLRAVVARPAVPAFAAAAEERPTLELVELESGEIALGDDDGVEWPESVWRPAVPEWEPALVAVR